MNAFTNIEKEKLWNTYKKCPTEKVARIAVDVEKVYEYSKLRPENALCEYSRVWQVDGTASERRRNGEVKRC